MRPPARAPAARLAPLAATLGRGAEAAIRFAEAEAAYETLGADAWLARARRDRTRRMGSAAAH